VVEAELALDDTGVGFNCSDHLAVAATLRLPSSSSSLLHSNCAGGPAGQGLPAVRDGLLVANDNSSFVDAGASVAAPRLHCSIATSPSVFSLAELVRQRPEPFRHAAACLDLSASAMARGRRRFARLATVLCVAGLGCFGAC
jgi:hypothetical protein